MARSCDVLQADLSLLSGNNRESCRCCQCFPSTYIYPGIKPSTCWFYICLRRVSAPSTSHRELGRRGHATSKQLLRLSCPSPSTDDLLTCEPHNTPNDVSVFRARAYDFGEEEQQGDNAEMRRCYAPRHPLVASQLRGILRVVSMLSRHETHGAIETGMCTAVVSQCSDCSLIENPVYLHTLPPLIAYSAQSNEPHLTTLRSYQTLLPILLPLLSLPVLLPVLTISRILVGESLLALPAIVIVQHLLRYPVQQLLRIDPEKFPRHI